MHKGAPSKWGEPERGDSEAGKAAGFDKHLSKQTSKATKGSDLIIPAAPKEKICPYF